MSDKIKLDSRSAFTARIRKTIGGQLSEQALTVIASDLKSASQKASALKETDATVHSVNFTATNIVIGTKKKTANLYAVKVGNRAGNVLAVYNVFAETMETADDPIIPALPDFDTGTIIVGVELIGMGITLE